MPHNVEYEPTDEVLSEVAQQFTNPLSYKNFLKNENKLTRAIISSSTGLSDPNNYNPLDSVNSIPKEYHLFHHNTSDNPTRLKRFLKNKKFLDKLTHYGWINDSKLIDIEYKINRQGLRCNNFSDEKSIIFVGCSHTYGTGVNEQYIWPNLVGNHFNYETINFGCPGLSVLIPTYHLLKCLPKIKNPTAIVLLASPISRVDLVLENNNFLTLTSLNRLLLEHVPTHKKDWCLSSTLLTSVLHYQLANETLRTLADNINIPYLSLELGDLELTDEDIDFARDLMHFGVKTHSVIANKIITKLGTLGLEPKSDK